MALKALIGQLWLGKFTNPGWLMTSMVETSSAVFSQSMFLVPLLLDFSYGEKPLHGATYYEQTFS